MPSRTAPRAMREAPFLDPRITVSVPQRRSVLFLMPFYPKDPRASFGKHVLTPSLALTSLAAATPAHWEMRYWDENLLQGPPPCDPFPEVLAITVHLTFARRAYELAAWYRKRGAKVILGGPHVIAWPEETQPHADAICIGEGVHMWPRILKDIEDNRLQHVYEGDYRKAYDEAPLPNRDILPREAFLTTCSLIATRGCHNRCGFCYLSTKGLHMPYQSRSPEKVVAEIIASRETYAVFTDNNLGADRAYLRRLCEALQPLKRIWSAAVSLDVTDEPDLVRAMALAGCTGVFVGFETLCNDNLSAMHKRCPPTEDYARRVEVFHRNGIQVNGSFVFGFDHDTSDVFEDTVEWIERNRLECATFHILTPYPGTPLFRQMEKEGRLLHRNWDLYDTGHAVFRPRSMTTCELEEGYAWCYRRLFSLRSIWERRPVGAHTLPAYTAMSLLYKKSNWFWHFLIRHRLTAAVWKPLMRRNLRRHLRFRAHLAHEETPIRSAATVIAPGV